MHSVYTQTGTFDHLTWKAAVIDVVSTLDCLQVLLVMFTRPLHRTVLHFLIHDLSASNEYAGINLHDNRKCDLV